MSRKYSIFCLVLLFAAFNIISKAEYTPMSSGLELPIEGLEFEMNGLESLQSAFQFAEDFISIIDQVYQAYQSSSQNMSQSGDFLHLLSQIDISPVCSSCQKVVELERKIPLWREIQTLIGDYVIKSCLKQNYALEYCSAMVQTYTDGIYNNIINKTLNPATACAGLFLCPRESHKEFLRDYVKAVLADKPTTSPPVPTRKATYNVLHITDLHIDLEYQVGANKKCGSPLCCRAEDGIASDPKDGAGFWGTVGHCDLPLKTFEQFLQFVANNFDIDMILWTGDNISHDIWHQNVENQTVNTYDATEDILKYFPNTFVYPMFGNHEAYPCDQFDMVDNTTSWLISRLADMWKVWLDENAVATFTNYSYYSIVNPVHNVKVIALDTQACDAKDFFLIQDPTDPFHQLEWLRKELYDSENNNQGVFIMGHIPPGDSTCDSQWSSRYRALVDRFTNTIRGQFFGHTHHDMFQVVRSYADDSPVGTAFVAASLTTDTNINPSFRIFEIDAETHIPLNYYQYRLDLNKWNKESPSKHISWDLAYSAVDEYHLADLSPHSMNELTDKIKTDNAVIKQYLANLNTVSVFAGTLTEKLIQNYFCATHHSVYEDYLSCIGIDDTTTAQLENLALQILPGIWHSSL